jgi:DNA-directed RNA polymerase subunit RPC12/RpoP
MSESTAVICSECGKGNFHSITNWEADFFCTECDSEVTWADFEGNGSEGESLVVIGSILHVVTVQS